MPSIANDKLTEVRDTTNPVVTTVSGPRSINGTSLSCVDLTGWPTGTAIHFATYQKNSDGTKNAATQQDWKAIKSGTTLGSMTLENSSDGEDHGNVTGDFAEMMPTAAWGEDLYDWGSEEHNNDGTHHDLTTDNITVTDAITLPAGAIGSTDIALDFVEATLASQFTSAGSNTWQNTGVNVTLPTAGKWMFFVDVRAEVPSTAGDFAAVRLFNTTTSAAITNSERLNELLAASNGNGTTVPLSMLVTTTTANNVVRLEIQPGGAYVCKVDSDSNGRTHMMAIRIG